MAGITGGASPKAPDVLFDLTLEDDRHLQESDLLQLVNYGQLQKSVIVPGTDGRTYAIEMALLWDEDHTELLKKTQQYSGDPILRVRVLRRLKLFKAIQKIDDKDYSDKNDPISQRQLWTVLSKLSDVMVEQLESHYKQIELERNITVVQALQDLHTQLTNTLPPEIKAKNKEAHRTMAADNGNDHQVLMTQMADRNKQATSELTTLIQEKSGEAKGSSESVKVNSPKQGANIG